MSDPQKNILKARCDSLGLVVRLLFWGHALYLAAMLGVGLWLAGRDAGAFSLRLLDTGGGLAGYGFYSGTARLEVDFARDALTLRALDCPKAVYLAGYFSAWAEKLFGLGVLGCVAGLFQQIDRDGSPFVASGCRAIAHIGWLILASGFVRAAFPAVLLGLLQAGGSGSGGAVWWSRLLAGGVVLCLSYIFEYGTALQTEAYETL